MIKKERVVTVEGLRDGKGSVEIHHSGRRGSDGAWHYVRSRHRKAS